MMLTGIIFGGYMTRNYVVIGVVWTSRRGISAGAVRNLRVQFFFWMPQLYSCRYMSGIPKYDGNQLETMDDWVHVQGEENCSLKFIDVKVFGVRVDWHKNKKLVESAIPCEQDYRLLDVGRLLSEQGSCGFLNSSRKSPNSIN